MSRRDGWHNGGWKPEHWKSEFGKDNFSISCVLILIANFRELSMPPLSTLNLSHNHAPLQSPPAAQFQPSQASYFSREPVTQQHPSSPQRHPVHVPRQPISNPVEASIQSWAGERVQQPQPMAPQANPMTTMWNPAMGIKFGGSGPPVPGNDDRTQQGERGSGTWNPNSGIKFG